MPSWTGLDDEIYLDVGEVKARLISGPPLAPPPGLLPGPPSGPPAGPALGPAALLPHRAHPTAILARQVASPSYETLWFARQARRHGLAPLVIEHRADRFTVNNPYKRSLATLPVVTGRDRHGRPIVRRQRVADHDASEGRRFEELLTRSGEPLLDYHHRKLLAVLGASAPAWIDLRDLVPPAPGGPQAYYVEFFRMLTGNLVLFEDFVACEQTAAFYERAVRPAFRQVVAETGLRPQVVRLSPGPRASSTLWYAYPAAVADEPVGVPRTRQVA